jgi:nucleotide-binding universal stress UspA family protein
MKLLLGTDGSDTAAAAVGFVAAFPFPADTEVKILSVLSGVLLDHEIAALTEEDRDAVRETREGTQRAVEDLVQSERARLEGTGWTVTTDVRSGHPAAEIVAAAEAFAADLIVVGSHGLSGFKSFLLGSVSSQVLQSAKQSVLIVRKPEQDSEGDQPDRPALEGHSWRLLVAYDGSDPSEAAVDFCSGLDLTDSASIRLLTVLPMVRMFRQDIRQEMNLIWQQKAEHERAAVDAAAQRVRSGGAQVTTELIEAGDVSEAVLEAGDEFDADLIILGHKGKGAVKRFLMGSVTPRIAHHASRSVLTIR